MSLLESRGPDRRQHGRPGSSAFEAWASPGFLTVALEHAVAACVGAFVSLLALLALQDSSTLRIVSGLMSSAFILPGMAGFISPRWAIPLRRSITAGIAAPVGILVPFLATGGPGRHWLLGPWTIIALTPLFAVLCDQVVTAGALARAGCAHRPWLQRTLPALVVIPLLSLWGISTAKAPAEEFGRMELAYDLHRQLTEYYPHWDTAPVRPDELWTRYRPALEKADRACGASAEPCPKYLGVLREMFAELRNGHTEILIQGELGRPAIEVDDVEGRAIVTRVEPDSDASAQGLAAGMEIVAVDGRSIDKALALVPGWRVSFSSERMRTYVAHRALLEGAVDEDVRIGVRRDRSSAPRVVVLRRERIRYDWEPGGEELEPEVASDMHPSDGGSVYVHVEGFEGDDAERGFDAVVDASLHAPGMILDLRENYGGVLDQAFRTVGRLLPEPLIIGEHCVAPRDESGRSTCTEHRIEPRGDVYDGPLAVLIDENVFSAGELAAFALCGSGRAHCFGTTTAGETDCVFRLDLPGAVARMSWAGFRPAFGHPLQGAGVDPDTEVARTIEDVRVGRDPVLVAAQEWLRGQTAAHAAFSAGGVALARNAAEAKARGSEPDGR